MPALTLPDPPPLCPWALTPPYGPTATNWSGPSAYMTALNAYPLQYDGMVEITEGA